MKVPVKLYARASRSNSAYGLTPVKDDLRVGLVTFESNDACWGVKVAEFEVEVEIPDELLTPENLVAGSVAGLREARAKIVKDYEYKLKAIDDEINNLLCLTHEEVDK